MQSSVVRALMPVVLAAACAAGLPSARAAEPAVLTVLQGEATLRVGARALVAVAGARLPAGSIVETSEQTGLLRLEWADGSRLDLGASTRVMLQPAASPRSLVYVLRGVVKQTQSTPTAGQLSPAFELKPFQGVVVTQIGPEGAVLFAESGGQSDFEKCDNIVASPRGDLIVCEDGGGDNYVRAITPDGLIYTLARSAGPEKSEICGACFSPDGRTWFINIQRPGITLAIAGPWDQLRTQARLLA
jgi:hypothetical protein